jgi:CHASE2 domain-containing sensor protein
MRPNLRKVNSMTNATSEKKHTRRTPEQIVADLQAKIESVQARAAGMEVKKSETGRALLAAVKAAEKALVVAQEKEDEELARALETARAALGEQLIRMGLRAPLRGEPRKRKAKGAA